MFVGQLTFVLAVLHFLAQVRAQGHESSVILSFLDFIKLGKSQLNLENSDNHAQLLKQYDFIVVGAGTAGCVMASRLSENPNWKVLLLEAGGPELLPMDVPLLVHMLQLSPSINWDYYTQPSDQFCLGMNDRRCRFPRGKVMGGSSVLNYMMYTRCNRQDYDAWAALGNEGWSYADVLPYFKKLEGSLVPDAEEEYVGRHGPVKISYNNWRTRSAEAFVAAVQEDGLAYRDYNGQHQVGVSYIQATTDQKLRWSSNRAYLYPLKGRRPNLHIRKNAKVTKILVDPKTKTAYGVKFESNGHSYEVRARREVILSAGAINTPQLLMLSGIGPAKHLRKLGIKPLADLAVGFNLQDHFAPCLTVLVNDTTTLQLEDLFEVNEFLKLHTRDSKLSSPGGVEAISFYALDNPSDPEAWPDMELFMLAGSFNTNPAVPHDLGIKDELYQYLYEDIIRDGLSACLIFPMILRPRSQGRIMLNNRDSKKPPLIFPNYLHDPYDLDLAVRGLEKVIELTQKPSLRRLNATVLDRRIPACQHLGEVTSRPYLECYVRHFTFTIYHQSGTAKMGPRSDRTAVVDSRLRVHGINKLRVVDASIMPNIVAGHPNGPVFMIAEKAADMIKEDYGFRG